MREFSQKRKIRRYMYSFPVLMFLFIILFFIIKGSFGVYQKYSFSKNELKKSEDIQGFLQILSQTGNEKMNSLYEFQTDLANNYRKKYDAQQVLAQFAQTARDEVEMEALQTELLRVVQETMQPSHISIWVKKESS